MDLKVSQRSKGTGKWDGVSFGSLAASAENYTEAVEALNKLTAHYRCSKAQLVAALVIGQANELDL